MILVVLVLKKIDFLMVDTVLHLIFNTCAIWVVLLPLSNKLQTSVSLFDNFTVLASMVISIVD